MQLNEIVGWIIYGLATIIFGLMLLSSLLVSNEKRAAKRIARQLGLHEESGKDKEGGDRCD